MTTSQALFTLGSTGNPRHSLILDSGASFHIAPHSSTLASNSPLTSLFCVFLANGLSLHVTHKGSRSLALTTLVIFMFLCFLKLVFCESDY